MKNFKTRFFTIKELKDMGMPSVLWGGDSNEEVPEEDAAKVIKTEFSHSDDDENFYYIVFQPPNCDKMYSITLYRCEIAGICEFDNWSDSKLFACTEVKEEKYIATRYVGVREDGE